MGSGYTETYRAANGSQVVEQGQRQVGPRTALERPAAGRRGGGGELRAPHASPFCRVTASTRATCRDTSTPPPASAPVWASGGSRRLGGRGSAVPHSLQRSRQRPRREGLGVATFLHTDCGPLEVTGSPGLWGSPRALQPVPPPPRAICPSAEGAASAASGGPVLPGARGGALTQNHLASLCPQGLFPGWLRCPRDRAPGQGWRRGAARALPGGASATEARDLWGQQHQLGAGLGASDLGSLQAPGEGGARTSGITLSPGTAPPDPPCARLGVPMAHGLGSASGCQDHSLA